MEQKKHAQKLFRLLLQTYCSILVLLDTSQVLNTRQVLDTGQGSVFCTYQGALHSGPDSSCGSCGSCASHSGIPGRFYSPARLGIAERLR